MRASETFAMQTAVGEPHQGLNELSLLQTSTNYTSIYAAGTTFIIIERMDDIVAIESQDKHQRTQHTPERERFKNYNRLGISRNIFDICR